MLTDSVLTARAWEWLLSPPRPGPVAAGRNYLYLSLLHAARQDVLAHWSEAGADPTLPAHHRFCSSHASRRIPSTQPIAAAHHRRLLFFFGPVRFELCPRAPGGRRRRAHCSVQEKETALRSKYEGIVQKKAPTPAIPIEPGRLRYSRLGTSALSSPPLRSSAHTHTHANTPYPYCVQTLRTSIPGAATCLSASAVCRQRPSAPAPQRPSTPCLFISISFTP